MRPVTRAWAFVCCLLLYPDVGNINEPHEIRGISVGTLPVESILHGTHDLVMSCVVVVLYKMLMVSWLGPVLTSCFFVLGEVRG